MTEPKTVGELIEQPETAPTEVPTDSTTAALDMIIRAATNPSIDVEKMERLMAMHGRLSTQRAKLAFDDAMASAQAEMTPVRANAENPQTKSEYADYAALDRALRPIYSAHGFSLSFDTYRDESVPENAIGVLCHVAHRGGFERDYRVPMPADGKGAKGGEVMTKTHAMGAAFTYGQRYLLKLIFNMAVSTDDDGNLASPVEYISAEQKNTLIARMQEVGADTTSFLRWLNVPNIDALPAIRFEDAMLALDKKAQASA